MISPDPKRHRHDEEDILCIHRLLLPLARLAILLQSPRAGDRVMGTLRSTSVSSMGFSSARWTRFSRHRTDEIVRGSDLVDLVHVDDPHWADSISPLAS